jgi:ATP-dependent Lhr-like helicase
VTSDRLADSLGVSVARIDIALAALEAEGFAMRGRFTPGAPQEEWCERRLLARIHRYTVKRLRAEVEAVPSREFLRFLCEWQRLLPEARMQGSDALAAVLAQLEGFEAPAAAWETEIIPARIAEYDPNWLDEHCRAGRFLWTRLAPRAGARPDDIIRSASPVRATPIVLLARRNAGQWTTLTSSTESARLTSKAQAVLDVIRAQGASFFDEIVDHAGMLPAEAEESLAELVATGLVNSDSFAGLRVLLMPSGRRGRSGGFNGRHKRRMALYGMADAGRWALVRRAHGAEESRDDVVELVVRTLLRRWGVIFWKLLTREAEWLPPWREILLCCRRLEARGEIRGGRFVAGFSGEQYATPEAVGLMREVRRKAPTGQFVSLSGADPLNLLGIITPGARLPSLAGNRLLLKDGLPIAQYVGGEVRFLEKLSPTDEWEAHTALLRRQAPLAVELDDPETAQ